MEPSTRKVVQRSPAHTVRLINLPHLQRKSIEADSSLERDFVHVAALFPLTRGIEHQPFRLNLELKRYTPDFLLTFKDGSRLVVEVKPQSKLAGYRDLFDVAAAELKTHGIYFMVATDTQIKSCDRAANALEIRRYGKTEFSEAECARALMLLMQHPEGLQLRQLCDTHAFSRELLFNLASRQMVALQNNLDIAPSARVFPINVSKEQSHAIQFASWFDAEIWG